MNITDVCKKYSLPQNIEQILNKSGYDKLFPPQEKAITDGLLGKKNFILAMPTASGKTLMAELCMLKTILSENGKCLYVAPLKALVSEKTENFKMKYSCLGIKIGMATGDYDAPTSELASYQILVATAEKVDSLLRFRARWLSREITLAVFDEIHFIDDTKRGPTLEILITRLRQINPRLKILGLSATIKNVKQIAQWLDAKSILSSWRPVPLREAVYYNSQIYFADGEKRKIAIPSVSKELGWIIYETVSQQGQVLVFVNTRRSTQTAAREIGKVIGIHLDKETEKNLENLSDSIKNSILEKTDLDEKLTEAVKSGTAFHHAGLRYSHRKMIEDAFKKNLIKVICATPTLAAGVNLPARRVVIRDYRRYEAGIGSHHIAVFEYKQMCGRAGRPKYDKYGEAILIAKSKDELDILFEKFVTADPEPITSKLGSENALRTHLLAAIAANYVKDKKGIFEFISRTFFAVQKDIENIEFIVEKIIEFLLEESLVEQKNGIITATVFGNLISRLYIDPVTGVILRNGLTKAKYQGNSSLISLLHLICSTPDMDIVKTKKSEYIDIENFSAIHLDEFLVPHESRYTELFHLEHLNRVKTTWMLEKWCEEEKEDKICKKFSVGPGDIRRYVEAASWIIYASKQLSKLFNFMNILNQLDKCSLRLKYGVKEELLELVKLKGIGRIRSRAIYSAGFKTVAEIKRASAVELSKIPHIGHKTAQSIKLQISEEHPENAN